MRCYKVKKIVLFAPKSTSDKTKHLPLGLISLERMFNKKEYEVKIISATVDKDYLNRTLEEVKGAICLGISSMTGYQIKEGLKVSKAVKSKYPKLQIVWGGYHPTILPKETCADPNVDIVVKGQGEITFKELVETIYNNSSLHKVKGIVFKENGKIIETENRELTDINEFPPLNLKNLEAFVEDYFRHGRKRGKFLEYVTSQGCPFNCGFCAEVKFSGRRWSGLRPNRVVDDLEYLTKHYNLDYIKIADNNFFVDKKRAKKICEKLIERKLRIKLVSVNGRIDTLLKYDDELWNLMKRAGISQIAVGAESGNQKALDLINKRITIKDIIELVHRCSKYKIKIGLSFMMGIPGIETEKEFKDTIELIDTLKKTDRQTILDLGINNYMPFPGSFLYEKSKQNGFTPPDTLNGWSKFDIYHAQSPHVNSKYSKSTSNLTCYILPYVFNHSSGNGLRLITNKILCGIAKKRWEKRNFRYPMGIILMQKIGDLKGKIL